MNYVQCVASTAQDKMPQSLNHYNFFRTLDFPLSLWERGSIILWRAGLSIKHLIITWEFYSQARVDISGKLAFSPLSTVFLTCEAPSAFLHRLLVKESLAKCTGLDSHIFGDKIMAWTVHLKSTSSAQGRGGAAHSPSKCRKCSLKWTRDVQVEHF